MSYGEWGYEKDVSRLPFKIENKNEGFICFCNQNRKKYNVLKLSFRGFYALVTCAWR